MDPRSPVFLLPLALLSAAIVWAMQSAGVTDRPDARKAHNRPTPKGGGVGVVAAVVAGAIVAGGGVSPIAVGAGCALALLSLLDDALDLSFAIKLGAQAAAACVAALAGLVLHTVDLPGIGIVALPDWAGIVVTVGWVLFATNAVNFIDGLNGLASGASLLAAAGLATIVPGGAVAATGLALAAGLAGFLPFNYPRARIFMGDVGSQFCGFILAVLSLAAAQAGAPTWAGPILLSGILFDVLFTLIRRASARDRVWQAHRSHLYQIAHRSGVPAWGIALLHWCFVAWGGVVIMYGPGWWPILVPQLTWTVFVVIRARRAGLGRW